MKRSFHNSFNILKQTLREAVLYKDVERAAEVADSLRYDLGYSYQDILNLLYEVCPELHPDVLDEDWENLMQEVEYRGL